MAVSLPTEGARVRMRADANLNRDRDPGLREVGLREVGLPGAGLLGTEALDTGLTDVWRIDLEAMPDGVGESLDGAERARAAQIVDGRRRRLWIRSRGTLRTLLGRYLECDPRGLSFQVGPYGKPALADGAGETQRLRFNLSHSGTLMLVAVSAEREVGVDVELTRPRHERHTVEFLREWTRREAAAKCVGTGLAGTPDEAALCSSRSGGGASAGLWTAEVDVGPYAVAALALSTRSAERTG